MYFNLKVFALVMLVAIAVFAIGRPVFTRFMTAEDFTRRRNLWLLLSAASFLSPNMWVYVLIAAPALLLMGARDPNPIAMYFFVLLAVPPVQVAIPTFGLIGQLFRMDHLRLLSLTLLLPLAFRLHADRRQVVGGGASPGAGLRAPDAFLLAFLGLQVILTLPYDTVTTTGRRIVLLFLDIVLPYFVVSRACRDRSMITEAMAAFVIGVAVLVPLGGFEFFKGWMLFAGIETHWEAERLYFSLFRGPFLRAQATAGHSIFLGYFMALAFGMWLYLHGRVAAKGLRWLCVLTLIAGLIVPLARGPWIGAATILLVYLALGPNASRRVLKGGVLVALVCAALFISPWGDQVLDYLPFVGTVDEHTVTQRQQLAAGSWLLIQQNPFFGSRYFLAYMEEFRTGEGIIDIVNTYAVVALSYGLVGVGLFVGVFVAAAWQAFNLVRRLTVQDPDAAALGAVLVACIVGTLLVLATTSFLHAMPYVVWSLLGLTVAYVRSGAVELSGSPAAVGPGTPPQPSFR